MGSLPLEDRIENKRLVVKGLLTRREQRALILASQGWETSDIAAEMQLSTSTVRQLIEDAAVRLGAQGRVQCISMARVRGLLDVAS